MVGPEKLKGKSTTVEAKDETGMARTLIEQIARQRAQPVLQATMEAEARGLLTRYV